MATAVVVRPEYIWVSVREAPSEESAVVGLLRCGYTYEINIIGEKDGYFVVTSRDEKEAYIKKECLEYVHSDT